MVEGKPLTKLNPEIRLFSIAFLRKEKPQTQLRREGKRPAARMAALNALATMILTSGQILHRPSMIVGCRFDFFFGKRVSFQSSSDFFRRF
jgi:hypothetical protein